VYESQTAPVVDYYKSQGKLVSVDGNRTPDDVFAEVEEKLGLE
jgi:adenylate kinase